jgi:hypothetical protein
MNDGGIIKNPKIIELVNKLFNCNGDTKIIEHLNNNRRWVQCPECNNLFETWEKDDHWCPFCKFKGNCDTAIQTIYY